MPGHHSSIAGGAIAGIVIGVLVAVALIAGGVLFLRRRRNKEAASTLESREAEARAARLEPVMQEGYPGFEMQNRSKK
jgi:hypothetical protein